MRISQADMDSRKRMANLRSKLTDAMQGIEDITYAELLIVLSEMTTTWARYLRADELSVGGNEVTE